MEHRFQPTRYYNTLGSHEPVLHVQDGDTIITTTVDARGYDASGAQVTQRGNPQTGPFYVEGAAPGDTLAVHLERITPSREHGWNSTVVAAHVVDPGYVAELPEGILADWRVDVERGVATLVEPATKLDSFSVPIRPMLGCFGVAPSGGQALGTGTSAQNGGNMDYRGF